ncbi:class I SAM-dependent methyltransferase [Candidatus Mycalebacterium sp.]
MSKSSELDKIASQYHNSKNIPDMFIEDIQQHFSCEIMQKHLDFQGKKVLELGYGEGIISEFLKKQTRELTTVEGSKKLAKKAEAKGFNIVECLFENYEPEEPCDILLANHVLEHVDNPAQILKMMKGWLKPEGRIFSIVPNRESIHRHIGLAMGLQKKLDDLSARDILVGHRRVYSLAELEADFTNSGFRVLGKGGYFLKMFANTSMLDFSHEIIRGFNLLSQDFPPEVCANIYVVAEIAEDAP